jgi:hypothetical protein
MSLSTHQNEVVEDLLLKSGAIEELHMGIKCGD